MLVLQSCIPGNLAEHKPVLSPRYGRVNVVTDGRLAREGTPWNSSQSFILGEGGLVVDLGGDYALSHLVVQGDNDDRYWVDGSEDNEHWAPIWAAPSVRGVGLHTRWTRLVQPTTARYLRVRGSDGDGRFSVAELQAYCQAPDPWPPKTESPPLIDRFSEEEWLSGGRFTVALLGCLVLLYGYFRRDKYFDAALIVLAVVGFGSFYNYGRFHAGRFTHIWDSYHYFIGGKYFEELGYTRLYECTAVAEAEDEPGPRVHNRKLRNLESNDLESTAETLAHPERCKERFTPERWQQFRQDTAYFRHEMPYSYWIDIQNDHGFNGTPFWSTNAGFIARWVTATHDSINNLVRLDVAMELAMWGMIWWAFGWRVMAVGLIFWGSNFPARYWWNGGAYLRMDWLFTLLGSLCLAKKDKPGWAGFMLGLSALLRIFPGFVAGAIVLRWLGIGVTKKQWRPSAWTRKFVLVFGLTLIAGVGVSTARYGAQSWVGFAHNSEKHLSTPLTNNMGLKSLVGWSPSTRAAMLRDNRLVDPFYRWKLVRRQTYHERTPQFLLLLLIFCIYFARVAADEDEATALILGVGLIVFAAELTCYYYSFMVAFAMMWPRLKPAALMLAVCALCSAWLPWAIFWEDDLYIAIGTVFMAHIVALLYLTERDRQQRIAGGEKPVT